MGMFRTGHQIPNRTKRQRLDKLVSKKLWDDKLFNYDLISRDYRRLPYVQKHTYMSDISKRDIRIMLKSQTMTGVNHVIPCLLLCFCATYVSCNLYYIGGLF